MGALRIIIIILLVALQAIVGIPDYMAGGPYLLRALTYSFFHAGWLHLAVNCIAVWGVYGRGRKPLGDLLLSLLVAVLVYPLSLRPVIGFSNVLYCTLGLRVPPFSHPWWKSRNALVFVAVTLGMVFIPRLSATTHIAAFLCGMLLSSLRRSTDKLLKDARRYY